MKTARQRILDLMQEFQIEPKKSLGQNFLISDHVIEKILAKVKTLSGNSLVEIGPGLGALTEGLKEINKPLMLIELDSKFAKYWRDQGLEVVEADALQWDWNSLKLPTPRLLVSNLPYQISSSLVIDRSLDQVFDVMVLMFQKEVAQKIKGTTKDSSYGMISVLAQTFWKIETLLEASSGEFLPPPKVASRVLVFQKIESEVIHREQYLKFLKACFLQPRKLMISNLTQGLGRTREQLLPCFLELGIKEKVRAQELNLKEFIALFKTLGYS